MEMEVWGTVTSTGGSVKEKTDEHRLGGAAGSLSRISTARSVGSYATHRDGREGNKSIEGGV